MEKLSFPKKLKRRYEAFIRERLNCRQTYNDLSDGLALDFDYLILIMISAAIATLGLIMNNAAVIIGAMIISPLMEPIISSGFAFAIDEGALGKRAAKTIGTGIIMAVFIAALITLLSPARDNTPEIMARTSPNVLDLGIALLCGMAGAYAFTFRKGAESVVGIAISVALMPPLCVAGFGLATLQADVLLGGLFLFVTNFSAIFIISTILFLLLGFYRAFNPSEQTSGAKVRRKFSATVILLALLAVPLVYTLNSSLTQKAINKSIDSILKARLEIPGQSRVSYWKITANQEIIVQVNTIENISAAEATNLQSELNAAAGQEYILRLVQVPAVYINGQKGQTFSQYLSDFARKSLGTNSDESLPADTEAAAVLSASTNVIPLPIDTIPQLYPQLYIISLESNYTDDSTSPSQIVIHSDPDSPLTITDLSEYKQAIQDNFAASEGLEVIIRCSRIATVTVYFEAGQAEISADYYGQLDEVVDFLQDNPSYIAEIRAYADTTESANPNGELSQARAEVIKGYLVKAGLQNADRVTAIGIAANELDIQTELEQGRREQRRAEISLKLY